jgi:hypothetical protein
LGTPFEEVFDVVFSAGESENTIAAAPVNAIKGIQNKKLNTKSEGDKTGKKTNPITLK